MKNSEIHLDLSKSEIRDFLAIEMAKAHELEFIPRRVNIISPFEFNYQHAIRQYEYDIDFIKNKIESLKNKAAISRLIKDNNWEEFDVSNETEKDLPYSLHLNFIGTIIEYENLLKKINL